MRMDPMPTHVKTLGPHFLGLASRSVASEQTDAELLARFVAARDGVAFAALVRRHGGMVLGVCRRLLRDAAAAEDAFQATFLLLSKKAGTIRKSEALASWLHGVARRTALKARIGERRRMARERCHQPACSVDPAGEVSLREACAILDEEVARLPAKYRAPLVLCCLEDLARDEAAEQLGWSVPLVKSRLEQARDLLRKRLTRRGVCLSAGLATVLLSTSTARAMPSALLGSTLEAVLSGTTSPSVAVLMRGVMQTMRWQGAKTVLTVLVGIGLVAGTVCIYLQQAEAHVVGPANHAMAWRGASKVVKIAQASEPGRIYFHSNIFIESIDPTGHDETQLPRGNPNDENQYQPHSARLSPDGKWLAFGLARWEGNSAYPPDQIRLRKAEWAERSEVVVSMPGLELHHWVWSADGKQLAFTSWDKENGGRSWVVDVATKQVTQLTLPTFKDENQRDHQMMVCDWSPDGQQFLASGKGVHLLKRDGMVVRCITEDISTWDGQCRFSPDGKRALVVGFNKDHSNTLYVVELADGKAKPIVESTNFMDMRAVWSPDGKRIAYAVTLMDANGKRGDETNLFIVDADGQNIRQIRSEKHAPEEVRLVLTDWR